MRSIKTIDVDPARIIADTAISIPVMVCAHERSGTHFLMNSIANNSRFSNDPFLNYDLMPLGSVLNFYDRKEVKAFFTRLAEHNCASIVKSHFAARFFLDQDQRFMLDGIVKTLYIARNPVEVMLSYHRFINHFSWHQGPKKRLAIDFLNAAPEGQMLRYQSGQADTILERWKLHLLGWVRTAAENDANVLVIRYQDLDHDHEAVMKRILSFLGIDSPQSIRRPNGILDTIYVPQFQMVLVEEREAIRKSIVEKIGYMEAIGNLFPELYSDEQASN